MSNIWGNEVTETFHSLLPDDILNSIEELGLKTTGRVIQLNSMENRVYEVELSLDHEPENPSDNFVIIKFYRPGRWSKEQIQEEHDFLFDLVENEIHAIAPHKFNHNSIFNYKGLYYTLFPKKAGRAVDEWNDELIQVMGRTIARVHAIGAQRKCEHRLSLDIKTFGEDNLEYILKSQYLPKEYKKTYEDLALYIFKSAAPLFKNINYQRVHGDCHHGNVLQREGIPFLIDFDDMTNAPRVQDIWMIAPGRDEYSIDLRNKLLDSYCEMADFDFRELKLIETLRSLRMIHFSSWIAHRFEDDAFKRIFTNFGTSQYWEKEIYDLKEQIGFIQDDLDSLGSLYQ
jgi:Ser/Thr protein kinase RdoA (MazF antagonist)